MGHKSRAERRHHHNRMLDKVKTFSYYWHDWHDESKKELHQKKTAENRKPCSCYMCCNPRRSDWNKDKLTMQEKKLKEDWERLKNDWSNIWDTDERG